MNTNQAPRTWKIRVLVGVVAAIGLVAMGVVLVLGVLGKRTPAPMVPASPMADAVEKPIAPASPAPAPPALPPRPPPAPPAPVKPAPFDPPTTYPATLPATGGESSPKAIPTAAEQAKSRELFRQAFATALADDSPAARLALANQLLQAAEGAGDTPTDQFVMLSGARQAAIEAGNVPLAIQANGALCDAFLVDAMESRAELFTRLAGTARTPEDCSALAKSAIGWAEVALGRGDYDTARQFSAAALSAGGRCQNPPLLSQAWACAQRMHTLADAYDAMVPSLAVLQHNRTDPQANLAVGRFYCFVAGQWVTGIDHLAAGPAGAISAAAKSDQAGKDPLAIADQWAALVGQVTPPEQQQIRLRAADWYRQAIPGLIGLERIRAENLAADLSAEPFRPTVSYFTPNPHEVPVVVAGKAGLVGLAMLHGHFEGGGEFVRVDYRPDGNWAVNTQSAQGDLHPAFAVYTQASGQPLDVEIRHFQWERGQRKVKMLPCGAGFCYLTAVGGKLAGGGENVAVKTEPDGFWYLDCQSGQFLGVVAVSVRPSNPKIFGTDIREVTWTRGSPPIKLIREDQGLCFLTRVCGAMQGDGDSAGLKLADDGYWYLSGTGNILSTGAVVIRHEN